MPGPLQVATLKMSIERLRLGFLAVGLTVACSLLMALAMLAPPGAKAASWMLDGANIEASSEVEVGLKADTLTQLLSKALNTTITIDCTEQVITSAQLEAGGKAKATVQLSSCTTELGGAVKVGCKPTEPIVASGTLEIVKHEGATYIKATNGASPFAEIGFNEKTCTLTNPTPVKGTFWLEDGEGAPEVEALTHLLKEGTVPAKALGGLKFGVEPATIDGSVIAEVIYEKLNPMKKFGALG
jgi:hypothetical protein